MFLNHCHPAINERKDIDERKVLWNSREIWNTEVSAVIGTVISLKYYKLFKKTHTIQCSKKQPLVIVVPFPTDHSVFCDLQEFLQINFQTLKHTSKCVI